MLYSRIWNISHNPLALFIHLNEIVKNANEEQKIRIATLEVFIRSLLRTRRHPHRYPYRHTHQYAYTVRRHRTCKHCDTEWKAAAYTHTITYLPEWENGCPDEIDYGLVPMLRDTQRPPLEDCWTTANVCNVTQQPRNVIVHLCTVLFVGRATGEAKAGRGDNNNGNTHRYA